MKDIENIIITEEESLNENSGNCHTEFEGGERKHGCIVCVCVRACVRACVCVCQWSFSLVFVKTCANEHKMQLSCK